VALGVLGVIAAAARALLDLGRALSGIPKRRQERKASADLWSFSSMRASVSALNVFTVSPVAGFVVAMVMAG
jgi:hypothetical protein